MLLTAEQEVFMERYSVLIGMFVFMVVLLCGCMVVAYKEHKRQEKVRRENPGKIRRKRCGSSDGTGAVVATTVASSSTSSCSSPSDSSGCM